MSSIKQVIVIRKDLKMRRGKEIAQGAHASAAFLSKIAQGKADLDHIQREWLESSYKKICVVVNSEKELMDIYNEAYSVALEVNLITDSGLTEFNGVPTITCLAIGPDIPERVDNITGHLTLY